VRQGLEGLLLTGESGSRVASSDRIRVPPKDGAAPEVVREGRVELPRPFGHRILSPARLPFRHSRVVEAFTSVNGGWGLETGQIRLQPGDAWEHGSLSAFPVVRHHVPAEAAAPRFFTRQPLSVGRFDSEAGEEVIEPQHEEDVLEDERSNNDLASHASSVMLAMLRARGGTVTLPCIRCSHGLCIDGPTPRQFRLRRRHARRSTSMDGAGEHSIAVRVSG
jgi:hypothetical protein